MQQLEDHQLQSVSQKLCQKFDIHIKKRDGPIVIHRLRVIDFGHKCNEGVVYTFQINFKIEESFTKFVEIFLNNLPAHFDKQTIKTILLLVTSCLRFSQRRQGFCTEGTALLLLHLFVVRKIARQNVFVC